MKRQLRLAMILALVLSVLLVLGMSVMATEDLMDGPATWAEEEVEEAVTKGLVPEDLQNNYSQSITREEFCVLAIKLIEVKADMSIEAYMSQRGMVMAASDTFEDSTNPSVLAAKTLGITDGTSLTTFDPDSALTREQAAKFLSATARAVGEDITAVISEYSDVDQIADWAKLYIGYVYKIDVMKGVGDNRFDPKGGYQRQQAFVTMNRLYGAIDEVSMDQVEGTLDTEMTEGLYDGIKGDIGSLEAPESYFAYMIGDSVNKDLDAAYNLAYDIYVSGSDIRMDTYMYDDLAIKTFYNVDESITYTYYERFSDYIEYYEGKQLPIQHLDVPYFEALEDGSEEGSFTARYESYDGDQVLYIKTTNNEGVTKEFWYSLVYLLPVKYYETWTFNEEVSYVDWSAMIFDQEIDMTESNFDLPENVKVVEDSYDAYWEDRFAD